MFELALWNKDVGINIQEQAGAWYKSVGRGMGATLYKALVHNGYTVSDRGTWIHFQKQGDLEIMVEGDKRLFNQYGVILVNPDKYPNVKKDLGQQFIDWLGSPEGQKAIAGYKINGEQLFFPNANDPNA
jgi:tungstate transport system substrate-binding protein